MSELLLDSVKSKYGAVAESTLSSDHAGVKAVAEAFGYSPEDPICRQNTRHREGVRLAQLS